MLNNRNQKEKEIKLFWKVSSKENGILPEIEISDESDDSCEFEKVDLKRVNSVVNLSPNDRKKMHDIDVDSQDMKKKF